MKITSNAFPHEGTIPRKYSCQGDNINPALGIESVPSRAVTLALIVSDYDVPTWVREDGEWDHWIVFNIDPKITHIEENTSTFAMFGRNTSGKNCYEGPCPPDREHRYFFRLYALDIRVDLKEGVSKKELLDAMQGHILEEAELMGRYTSAKK